MVARPDVVSEASATRAKRLRERAVAITGRWFDPIDVASLAAFRIAFGGLLLWEVWRYFRNGWVSTLYDVSAFHFTFAGFGWVKPLPGDGMSLHFFALGLVAALAAVGLWFRAACLLLSFGWTYVLLIEKTEYLNHQYLICLLTFLMAFSGADRAFSLRARRRVTPSMVPAWCLWLMRFQITLPYVFGGIAKLNGDWLHGQPMQVWMSRMTHLTDALPFFAERSTALVFSYGGLLLDLLIVPCLLWKPTRFWAFIAAIGFHLLNAAMFRIGVFPWLMICATTLFLPPDWPRRLLRLASPTQLIGRIDAGASRRRPLALTFLTAWMTVQLLVPLRHFLYAGDVAWTEEGARFSWRMMLTDKAAALRITAHDPISGRTFLIDPRNSLSSPKQIERMTQYPDMLHEFSRFISRELADAGYPQATVNVLDLVSLNGRKPQPLVDPTIDLGRQPVRFFSRHPWIMPLTEPRPREPWLPPPTWGGGRGAAE